MNRKQRMLMVFFPQYYRPFGFLPLRGRGIELGSREGKFAKILLKNTNIEKLYLVDPFMPYLDGLKMVTQTEQNCFLKQANNRLSNYKNYIRVMAPSHLAAAQIEGGLDFIYIDGDHSYEAAKLDIETWWPKMKKGAFFGGHDFHHDWPGVIKAVFEHCEKYKLDLHVETPDWWVEVK